MAEAAGAGDLAGGASVRERVEALRRHAPLAAEIEAFWRLEAHRRQATWTEHRDINDVMLATSLVPDGFLHLPPVATR
jgi:hypothetical protein